MRRRRAFRDPTGARADTSLIGEVLAAVNETEAALFVMVVVLGQPLQQAARLLDLPEEKAEARLSVVTSRLRHPSLSQRVGDEFLDGQAAVSAQLRSWTREISEALYPRCARCDAAFMPSGPSSSRGGRPRRFCSSACRQAAYRKRLAAAETTPEKPALHAQRMPNRPQSRNPRPALCADYHYDGFSIGCLLHRGHRAEHLALCSAAGNRVVWACWAEKNGSLAWHPVCAAAEDSRQWAPRCALPEGHRGTHVLGSVPWVEPWDRVGEPVHLDRSLQIALRIRLSPLAGRPARS